MTMKERVLKRYPKAYAFAMADHRRYCERRARLRAAARYGACFFAGVAAGLLLAYLNYARR